MKEPTVDSWQRETAYVCVTFIAVLLLGMALGMFVHSCEVNRRDQAVREVK